MINNSKFFFFFIFIYFTLNISVKANEVFVFDVTEIEILENGNKIKGYNGGTATADDGSKITADQFFYNKLTNILEAQGNVKFIDKFKDLIITSDKAIYFKNKEKIFTVGNSKAINKNNVITAANLEYDKIKNIFNAKINVKVVDFEKDTVIFSDKITYLKNNEKIFTTGKTKALIEKKYTFDSENVYYLRDIGELSSKNKSTVKDDDENIYKLNSFIYEINNQLLKGQNVDVISKFEKDKTDQFHFSEGFFNFKDKSYIAKKTKIKIHKDVFDNKEQDPRVYGSSSFSNENKTVIHNGIFTSCKINDSCPPWSIEAKKIIHDKKKRDMIYKNAILKIYDVPILYFPKFFHPDPSVKRRTGFLQPQFNNSETLGSSLHIPYFKTLGLDKDLTFKPTLFENDKYILQNEFRKKNKSSSLIADFSFLTGYKSPANAKKKNINHFFLDFKQDLKIPNYIESKLEAQIERVSNDTYLKVFQNNLFHTPVMPENNDIMSSNLKLVLDQDNQTLSTGVEIHESLGVNHSDRYEYVFPYYDFSKDLSSIFSTSKIDGTINFYSSGTNTLSNTNNLMTKIINDIEYSSLDFISNVGLKNNLSLYFKNLNTVGKKDAVFTSSPQIDGSNIIKIDTSFPLAKFNNLAKETLTPKISFRVNPANNMGNHSQTGSIIDANNAFDINRLGVSESFEAGKSITLGLDYKFDKLELNNSKENDNESKKIKDKYLEIKLATIIRDKFESNIPVSSTTNRKNSNIFGSIENKLIDNLNIGYTFSLDNDLETINYNSINAEISINNFVTNFDFIEERNEIGSTHVVSNTTEYKVDDNNSIKFSTRRNKEINLTEYYDLSYEYQNDCLTAALKFNKVFYRDSDLLPSEDLFFTITLIPLTTYEREVYKRNDGWFR